MKKKMALLMTALVGTMAFALVGCKTKIGWIDKKICDHDECKLVEVVEEATCEAEGKKIFECVDCGKTITEKVEKLAHTEKITAEGKEATCTEKGMTDEIFCEVCEAVVQEQEEIPVIAHVDEDEDSACDECGAEMDAPETSEEAETSEE